MGLDNKAPCSLSELGFELGHIGINTENENDAKGLAELFCAAFGFDLIPGATCFFAGTAVECMKAKGFGRNGHIAIKTDSLPKAVEYLASVGFRVDDSTAKYDADGNRTIVYLEKDFGGFAVHLLQK